MKTTNIGQCTLIQGDCLEVMQNLIKQGVKVDEIITDPPYGTTACKWDSVIPFEPMWDCLHKLIKDNGAIVLFGNEPFSSALRMSNIKNYKYDWIWKKSNVMGFLNAKKRPLKEIENILVFNSKIYNPQGLIKNPKGKNKRGSQTDTLGNYNLINFSEYTNYPKTILEFKSERGLHPTQKPVALLEYLVKTYTNESDVVLDFTAGSFTTGVACQNLGRKFIGIELDKQYYEIGVERMKENQERLDSLH